MHVSSLVVKIKQLLSLHVGDFRGRYSVSGATVQILSLATRVGSWIERRFAFRWDLEPWMVDIWTPSLFINTARSFGKICAASWRLFSFLDDVLIDAREWLLPLSSSGKEKENGNDCCAPLVLELDYCGVSVLVRACHGASVLVTRPDRQEG